MIKNNKNLLNIFWASYILFAGNIKFYKKFQNLFWLHSLWKKFFIYYIQQTGEKKCWNFFIFIATTTSILYVYYKYYRKIFSELKRAFFKNNQKGLKFFHRYLSLRDKPMTGRNEYVERVLRRAHGNSNFGVSPSYHLLCWPIYRNVPYIVL